VLRKDRNEYERVRAQVDPENAESLREHLVAAIKRNDLSTRDIGKYVLDVYKPGFSEPEFSFTAIDEYGPQ
jgi:hypothetical protein